MFVPFAIPGEAVPTAPMDWVALVVAGAFTVIIFALATYMWRAENPADRSVVMALVFYGVGFIAYAAVYWTSLFPLLISASDLAEVPVMSREDHTTWAVGIGTVIVVIGIAVGIVQAILERRTVRAATEAESKAAL